MYVWLANIDGVIGVEVLAYRVTGTQVYAYRGDGSLVRGWPVQGLGTEGKIRHVILDDLDDDGSLEVIAFSDGRLDIVSLGGDSFDPAATPWPMALRDRQRSGAHRGEAAP